jgi:hypothetical protein
MSAHDAKMQIDAMMNEIEDAVCALEKVQEKLESVQGGAILLGLTESQNMMISGLIEVTQSAQHNRETLWRFMFNIRERLRIYREVL